MKRDEFVRSDVFWVVSIKTAVILMTKIDTAKTERNAKLFKHFGPAGTPPSCSER
jgi:hypothetical protein